MHMSDSGIDLASFYHFSIRFGGIFQQCGILCFSFLSSSGLGPLMVTCLESATFPARQRYLLYISGIKIVVHCSFCKKAKFVISTSSPYIFSGDLP